MSSLALVAAITGLFGGSGATRPEASSRAVEIAAAGRQVDAIEADAAARIATLTPASSDRMAGLGKASFYDKAFSAERNEACAFHIPQIGYQGAIDSLGHGGEHPS